MLKQVFDKSSNVKEFFIIALFLSITILYYLFQDFNFSLSNFDSIIISEATLNGVDIGKRVSLFYKVIGAFCLLLPLSFTSLNWLNSIAQFSKNNLQILSLLSSTCVVLIFANVYGIKSEKVIQVNIFLFFFLLLLFALKTRFKTLRILSNNLFLSRLLIISLILLSALLFLANGSERIVTNGVYLYFLILVSLCIGALIIKKFTGFTLRKVFIISLPIVLVPIFIFFSIELLFFIKAKSDFFIPYKWVFIALLFGSFLLFTIYSHFKKFQFSISILFANIYIPSALLSILLLTVYHPIIDHPTEMFELANPAIAQLKIFSFGEIPFVDFLTSHMFSEQFYGIIYNSIFGFDGSLDFLVYQFLYTILFFFLIYFFLVRLLNSPYLAILFIVSFPFLTYLFHIYLFFSVVLFFSVTKLITNQSVKNFLGLFTLIALLCFWRLDTGFASLLAALVFISSHYFTENKKVDFKNAFKSTSIFSAIVLVVLFTVIGLRSFDFISTSISSALHYFSGSQAHGLSHISLDFNQQFFTFHTILPLGSILIIGYIIYLLKWKSPTKTKFSLNASLFFFLVYLFNFQRALVRHGFIENVDFFIMATFYIAMSLFLFAVFLKKYDKSQKYILFLSISFLVIILLKYFPLEKEELKFNSFFNSPSISYLDHKFNESSFKGRVNGKEEFADNTYSDFKGFLDENLTKNQTFLDYSNTPMLYFYCQRNPPSYFCQNLQNTVDDYLQNEQLKRINTTNTPVVVFSNYPSNWWDETDGIPNIMRQNLIAEHIYRFYKPFRVINNHSIWVAKELDFSTSIKEVDTLIDLPQKLNYKYSAGLINSYFYDDNTRLEELMSQVPKVSTDKKYYQIKLTKATSNESRVMVKVDLKYSYDQQDLNIELYSDSSLVGTSTFFTKKDKFEYLIPLSNHYLWYKGKVNSIRIPTNESYTVNKISILKDIRDEY